MSVVWEDPPRLMDGLAYFIVVRDGWQWLIVEVIVNGPATVLGRWDDKAQAERECDRWIELAQECVA